MNQTVPTGAAPQASARQRIALAIVGAIARVQGRVAVAVRRLPGWPLIEWAAEQVARPVKALPDHALRRMPWLRRAEWLLETARLRHMNPVILTVALLIALWRGLRTTPLGHIGTDPLIYPLIGSISCFNPFLGFVSAVAFGVGDLAQKLVYNDIYAAAGRGGNYWGAMSGYVVAYSAVMVMGLLPGVLSRVGRHAVRLGLQQFFFRRAAATADGAEPQRGPTGGEYPILEFFGAVLGGGLGAYGAMRAAVGLEYPAFYLRPTPDVSCYENEANNYLLGRAGAVGRAVAVGGTVAHTLLTPQQGGQAGAPPEGGGPPGGSGSGRPVSPEDARRINQLNAEVQDPALYRRLQSVIDRARQTGTVDQRELSAIVQAQEQLSNQRAAQITTDQTAATEDWQHRQDERHRQEAAQEARQAAQEARDQRAADLVNHARDVIAQMQDPARRRFLTNLFDNYARRNAGDPERIGSMYRAIRGELANQRQVETDQHLNTADTIGAFEDTAHGVRNAAALAIQTYLTMNSPAGVLGLIHNGVIGGTFGAGTALLEGRDARGVLFEGVAGAGGSLFSAVSAPGLLVNAAIGTGRAMMNGETDPRDLLLAGGGEAFAGALIHVGLGVGERAAQALGNRFPGLAEEASRFFRGTDPSSPVEHVSPDGPRPFLSEPNEPWARPPERRAPAGEGHVPADFGNSSSSGGPGSKLPRLNQLLGDIERASGKDSAYEYLQGMRRRGVITDQQFDALRARWDNPVHDATMHDPWHQYRAHGQPWTPQIERHDCSVASLVDSVRKTDPHLTYEEAEGILNGFRRQRPSGSLGGLPPDQVRPALDALAAARGWSSPPARLAEVLGTRSPAAVGARLGEFFQQNPGARIFAGVRTPEGGGHMVTITGVDANGNLQVIDPTGGPASIPPDKLHVYPEHSYVIGGPAESGRAPASPHGGESPPDDLSGLRGRKARASTPLETPSGGQVFDTKGEGRRPSDPSRGMMRHNIFEWSDRNLQRMLNGHPPVGTDGEEVVLHHLDQAANGYLEEYTHTQHTQMHELLHDKDYSTIDRSKFAGQRQRYWRTRAREYLAAYQRRQS